MDAEDLKYPIGRFVEPVASTLGARAADIAAVGALPSQLRDAVDGLTDAQLDTPYRAGGWTVRQVVHHVADSHVNSFVRFKLALTEDWPTIKTYDQDTWVHLADSRLPVEPSLNFVEALHTRWKALLEAMSEADFERGFHHPEMGRQTLAQSLALYAWHGRHHTAHITRLRQRQNW